MKRWAPTLLIYAVLGPPVLALCVWILCRDAWVARAQRPRAT